MKRCLKRKGKNLVRGMSYRDFCNGLLRRELYNVSYDLNICKLGWIIRVLMRIKVFDIRFIYEEIVLERRGFIL